MALAKLQSAEDWEPHLEEIHQLYITENKSVPDLIDHFKSQDILVTKDQLKKLFQRQGWSRTKTLRLHPQQWIVLGATLKKRKRDDKDTKIYVDNREADLKKVRRSIRRYQGQIDCLERTPSADELGDNVQVVTPGPFRINSDVPVETEPSRSASRAGGYPLPQPELRQFSDAENHPSPAASFSSLVRWSSPERFPKPSMSVQAVSSPAVSWPVACGLSFEEETDWGDLETLDRILCQRWTSGLSYNAILKELKRPGLYEIILVHLENDQQQHDYPFFWPGESPGAFSLGTPESWSLIGLKRIVAAICDPNSDSGVHGRLQHPPLCIDDADAFQLLDVVVSTVVCLRYFRSLAGELVWHDVVSWFTDERHLPILRALRSIQSDHLKAFANNWTQLSLEVFATTRKMLAFDLSRVSLRRIRILQGIRYQAESNQNWEAWDEVVSTKFRSMDVWKDPDLCDSLLEIATEFHRAPPWNNIRWRREISRTLWFVIVNRGFSKTVEYLLKRLAAGGCDLTRLWNDHVIHGHGCYYSYLGLALVRWTQRGASEGAEAHVVRQLIDYATIDTTQQCWEGFTPPEICAMAGTPTAEGLVSQFFGEGQKSPTIYVAESARKPEPDSDQRLQQLLSNGEVSLRELNIILTAATHLGCVPLVHLLLRNGIGRAPEGLCWEPGHIRSSSCLLQMPWYEHIAQLDENLVRSSQVQMACIFLTSGGPITGGFLHSSLVKQFCSKDSELRQHLRRRILESDENYDKDGLRLLDLAVEWEDIELFDGLKQRGIDASNENTSLDIALEKSSIDTVRVFWQMGAWPETAADGRWSIWGTCQSARDTTAKLEFLLAHGAAIQSEDLSELLQRPYPGSDHIFWFLKQRSNDNFAFLAAAAGAGRPGILQELLDNGVQVPLDDSTADFFDAVAFGMRKGYNTARSLLNVVLKASNEQRLDVAALAGHMIKTAADQGYISIVLDLLKLGVDVNGGRKCKFRYGYCELLRRCETPLLRAVASGSIDMVKLLARAGAEGFKPISYALLDDFALPDCGDGADLKEIPGVLDGLNSAGVHDYSADDKRGGTKCFEKAIECAELNSHFAIADMLRRYQSIDTPRVEENTATSGQVNLAEGT